MKLRENCAKKSDENFGIDREPKKQKLQILSGNLRIQNNAKKNAKTNKGGNQCHVSDRINFPRRYLNENACGDRFSRTALMYVM